MISAMITRQMNESNGRQEKSPVLKDQRPGMSSISAVWFPIQDGRNMAHLMAATDRVRE